MAGAGGIGEYQVGAALREGWGGTIRGGTYRRTGRRVTVQEVRPDLTATPGLVERLGSLGRDAAAVRDPHLLAVYDLVGDSGSYRLIAEWSDGDTLAARLRRGSLAPAQAIAAVCDVLAGLEALHARGLFHGHVGPETVVVDGDGTARLAELALCAAAAPAGSGIRTPTSATPPASACTCCATPGSRLDAVRRLSTPPPRDRGSRRSPAVRGAGRGSHRRARTGLARTRPWRRHKPAAGQPRPSAAADRARGTRGRRRGRRRHPARGQAERVVPSGPLTLGSDATLTATPVTGGCNTTFSFVGRGSLSGTGTLVYRWEQSDGQVTADTSLPITPKRGRLPAHPGMAPPGLAEGRRHHDAAHPQAGRPQAQPDVPLQLPVTTWRRLAQRNPLPGGAITVGIGLLLAGVCTYAFLAIAGHALTPLQYSAFASFWALLFVVAPGIFLPLEQELARAIAARRARGDGGGPVVRRVVLIGGAFLMVLVVAALLGFGPIDSHLLGGDGVLMVALLLGLTRVLRRAHRARHPERQQPVPVLRDPARRRGDLPRGLLRGAGVGARHAAQVRTASRWSPARSPRC